jgi:rhodanese-related sulfurtransferase
VPTLDRAALAQRIAAGEWVVDLRNRTAYAADHIAGTISIGLCPQFATYLGWVFPYGQALTLIGESEGQVADAQRDLVRIGIERPTAAAIGGLDALAYPGHRRSFPTVGFGALADMPPGDVLVDVRRPDERAGSEIPGSLHVPLHQLLTSMSDVPHTRLWVHCASGFRASIAASVLARAGRDVVLVDDMYSVAVELGLAVAA